MLSLLGLYAFLQQKVERVFSLELLMMKSLALAAVQWGNIQQHLKAKTHTTLI